MATNNEDDAFTFPGDDEPAFRDPGRHPGDGVGGAPIASGGLSAPASTDTTTTRDTVTAAKVATNSDENAATPDAVEPVAGDSTAKRPLPSVVLVFYGFVAGWMALYTLGWVVVAAKSWVFGTNAPLLDILTDLMLVLMSISPLLWMLTAIVATRGKRMVWTALWLLIGIVLLLPWPYLIALQVGAL